MMIKISLFKYYSPCQYQPGFDESPNFSLNEFEPAYSHNEHSLDDLTKFSLKQSDVLQDNVIEINKRRNWVPIENERVR